MSKITNDSAIGAFEMFVAPGIIARFPGNKEALRAAWEAWLAKMIEKGNVTRRDAMWFSEPDCCV